MVSGSRKYPTPAHYRKLLRLCYHKRRGYLLFTDKEHPLAGPGGFVYLHRHVAACKLGRWLYKGEEVHHKDENKLNNSPGNLQILTRKAHARLHATKYPPMKKRICSVCGKLFLPVGRDVKFCSVSCGSESQQKLKVSPQRLRVLVWSMPSFKVAKLLGVSPTLLVKWCKRWGIAKPKPGYWKRGRVKGKI